MKNNFSERRLKLSDKVLEDSAIIVASALVKARISDTDYAYRQDSNFYYLSGYEEPDSLLLIRPNSDKEKFIIDPHTATAFGAINKIGDLKDTVALGTAHPYKFLETVKKATGKNVETPHQLEKFIDKDEKFDIVENNNINVKNYILNKLQ